MIKDKLKAAFVSQSCKRKVPRLDRAGNIIEWRLTFEEWLKIWEDSGHLHERGKGKDKYCMSRKNDLGHYEVGNVFIQKFGQNSSDGAVGNTFGKNRVVTSQARENISRAAKRRFASQEQRELNRQLQLVAQNRPEVKAKKAQTFACKPPAIQAVASLQNPIFFKNGKMNLTAIAKRDGIKTHYLYVAANKAKVQSA